jgi:hypothetical protein
VKKLIIGILFVIPLVIVASVFLASGLISMTAYISVDEVILNYTKVDESDGFTITDNVFTDLKATVFPKLATNKKIIWSIEEIARFDTTVEGEIATVDENGVVTGKTYGAFYVIATSEEGNKRASCLFHLASAAVDNIELLGEPNMSAGEAQLLTAVFRPTDCLVTDVEWSSSDASVATVDKNGIVKAHSAGTAEIICRTGGAVRAFGISVAAAGSRFGNEFFISESSVSLSELGIAPSATAVSGCEISSGSLSFTGGGPAVLSSGGQTVTIGLCGENDIEIEQKRFMNSATSYRLEVGSLPYFFTARYKDALRAGVPAVSWSSSAPDIAEIDSSGRLRVNAAGEFTVTAAFAFSSDSVNLVSRQLLTYMVLNKNAADDARGIAAETIRGAKKFDEGSVIVANTITFAPRLPLNCDPADFYYTSDSEYAVFSGNVLTLAGGFSGEITVNVNVTAKYPKYSSMPVGASYSFKMADAVEVSSEAELRTAADANNAVALTSNITFDGFNRIHIRKNLYGNGRILDNLQKAAHIDISVLNIAASGVKVSNAVLRVEKPINNQIVKAGLSGTALCVNYDFNGAEENYFTDVTVEYCIVESCNYGIMCFGADITVRGCVLRNTSGYSFYGPIYAAAQGNTRSNILFINSVLSNSVVPSIGISSFVGEAGVRSTFRSQGFLDIYNWQSVNNIDLVGDITGNDILNQIIVGYIRSRYMSEEFEDFRIMIKDEAFVHLGLFAAGLTCPVAVDVLEIEDPRFRHLDLPVIPGIDNNKCEAWVYDKNSSLRPGEFYKENAEFYARLRGESD